MTFNATPQLDLEPIKESLVRPWNKDLGVTADAWNLIAEVERLRAGAASPATPARAGWTPLTADSLPTGKVLVTNNLAARDANGDMSHVWIAAPMVSSEPESAGEIVSFDDDFVKLRGLTHWHSLPSLWAKSCSRNAKDPLHPRHPYDVAGSEYLPETCSHFNKPEGRVYTCRDCALFAINRLTDVARLPASQEEK